MILRNIVSEDTVNLIVHQCAVDIENSEALRLAHSVDPDLRRTMIVLTKPDQCQPGDERSPLALLEGRAVMIGQSTVPMARTALGCVVVRNRTTAELEKDVPIEEARAKEEEFFRSSPVFSSLDETQRGVRALTNRLTTLLVRRIKNVLPTLAAQLGMMSREAEHDLRQLGTLPNVQDEEVARRALSNILRKIGSDISGLANSDPVQVEDVKKALAPEDLNRLNAIEGYLIKDDRNLREMGDATRISNPDYGSVDSSRRTMFSFMTLHEQALRMAVDQNVPNFTAGRNSHEDATPAGAHVDSAAPADDSFERREQEGARAEVSQKDLSLHLNTTAATHHCAGIANPKPFEDHVKAEVDMLEKIALQHLNPVHHVMISFCRVVIHRHAHSLPNLDYVLNKTVGGICAALYKRCEEYVKQYFAMRRDVLYVSQEASTRAAADISGKLAQLYGHGEDTTGNREAHGDATPYPAAASLQRKVLVYWTLLSRSVIDEVTRAARWFLVTEASNAIEANLSDFLGSLTAGLRFASHRVHAGATSPSLLYESPGTWAYDESPVWDGASRYKSPAERIALNWGAVADAVSRDDPTLDADEYLSPSSGALAKILFAESADIAERRVALKNKISRLDKGLRSLHAHTFL